MRRHLLERVEANLMQRVWFCIVALLPVIAAAPLHGADPQEDRTSPAWIATGSADFPIYSFVDRATSTRCCRQLGDFDLLASMGFRAYAAVHDNLSGERAPHFLTERAEALGLAVIAVRGHFMAALAHRSHASKNSEAWGRAPAVAHPCPGSAQEPQLS